MATVRKADQAQLRSRLEQFGLSDALELAAEIGSGDVARSFSGTTKQALELIELRTSFVIDGSIFFGLEELRNIAQHQPERSASIVSIFGSRWDGMVCEDDEKIVFFWKIPVNREMTPSAEP